MLVACRLACLSALEAPLSVAEASSKFEKFSDLNVPVSGLYLLAAQRPEVQEAVLEAVEFSAS